MTKLEEIEKRLSEYRGYTAFHSDVNAQEDIRYLLDEVKRLEGVLNILTSESYKSELIQTFKEESEAQDKEITRLKALLSECAAHCGHPDPAEGCRIILSKLKKELGE